MIDKQDLVKRMRYASKYNKPCPDWVYKLIEATPEDKNEKDVDEFTTYIPGIFELENGSESINRQEAADAIAGNLGDSVCERIAVDILANLPADRPKVNASAKPQIIYPCGKPSISY